MDQELSTSFSVPAADLRIPLPGRLDDLLFSEGDRHATDSFWSTADGAPKVLSLQQLLDSGACTSADERLSLSTQDSVDSEAARALLAEMEGTALAVGPPGIFDGARGSPGGLRDLGAKMGRGPPRALFLEPALSPMADSEVSGSPAEDSFTTAVDGGGMSFFQEPPGLEGRGSRRPSKEACHVELNISKSLRRPPLPEAALACHPCDLGGDLAQMLQLQSSLDTSGPLSVGSIGHPFNCSRDPCKYASKPKGCKDGKNCVRCHHCVFRRTRRSKQASAYASTDGAGSP